jgi:hypothetical protein
LAKRVSNEFSLAVACCNWPPCEERNLHVKSAARGVEWELFLRLAQRHRIQGLVWRSLQEAEVELPEKVSQSLAAAAAEIARKNLLNAAESLKLQRLLQSASVSPLFVKGVALSVLAYGTLSLKMGWDIDVLVPSKQLECAAHVLQENGYTRIIPGLEIGDAQLHTWHRHWKESVWRHESGGTYVELHSALVDNPLLLRDVGAFSHSQDVELVRGSSVRTLAKDELFAYLCVHGASSGWFRLKWLADLAALLALDDAEEVERLYRRSQQLGAGRAAAQALLLAASLFGSNIGSALLRELRSSWTTRLLYQLALNKMSGRTATTELDEIFLGTASIHAMQLGLLPGWRFKASELMRQGVDLIDRVAPHLPAPTRPLYYWLLERRPLRRYP